MTAKKLIPAGLLAVAILLGPAGLAGPAAHAGNTGSPALVQTNWDCC